jgi:hypothetical protein
MGWVTGMRTTFARTFAALVGLLLAACASSPVPAGASVRMGVAAPEWPDEPLYVYYDCRGRPGDPKVFSGYLDFWEVIREDGVVLAKSVNWTTHYDTKYPRDETRPHAPQRATTHVTLTWEDENGGPRDPSVQPKAFDWRRGKIQVNHFEDPANADRYRSNSNEPWRRVVVDRDNSLTVSKEESGRFLGLWGLDMNLNGELSPPGSPNDLRIGLEKLLAYGTGAEKLTVYETAVSRMILTNSASAWGIGRHRILTSYDLDLPLIHNSVAWIREQEAIWRESISDYRNACERHEFFGEEIVVVT